MLESALHHLQAIKMPFTNALFVLQNQIRISFCIVICTRHCQGASHVEVILMDFIFIFLHIYSIDELAQRRYLGVDDKHVRFPWHIIGIGLCAKLYCN
jgi:hypothetical protein